LHNSSVRLIRHFFLIPLRWRIRQILLYSQLFTRFTSSIRGHLPWSSIPRSLYLDHCITACLHHMQYM